MIQTRQTTERKPLPPEDNLRFGQHFSDHWFCARYAEGKGWYDARIEPYGNISLDPAASVFHYGQALFEGMKAFRQHDGHVVLFRPEYNYSRMVQGAERLCLPPPSRNIFMDGLRELVALDERWVPKQENCSLYIRPTLIGVEPFLGVRPSREAVFFILLSPVGSYYSGDQECVRIFVEENAVRAVPGGLGATKAGANYAASLQTGMRAKAKGFAQVLWLDHEHMGIEEVGTMNVFFVFRDEIVTPGLNGSILAGCVRDSVIRWLGNVRERRITIDEVVERHARGELLEAFGTGTAAVISPIGELNYRGRSLLINDNRMGDVSRRLLTEFTGLHRGTQPDKFGWIHPISSMK